MKTSLLHPDRFIQRHIGPGAEERNAMLAAIGVGSLEELIEQTVPASIRLEKPLDIEGGMSEQELLAEVRRLGAKNELWRTFIGMGYYNTITPTVILRNVLENPGWYTQYTPYQAEIAQGRLEALLNYQTVVAELTGLPIANASLLDEATAAAEAMSMLYNNRSRDKAKNDASTFFVDQNVFPQVIDVIRTRATPLNIDVVVGDVRGLELGDDWDPSIYAIYVQNPAGDGHVRDLSELCAKAHQREVTVAMGTDLMALLLVKSPGEMGADVAVGSAQRFGVPMGYGGPHAAFFATKDDYKRFIPGRIIGASVDSNGNRALRMALQTREQHIRRDKATSNICTAQALLAIMASMYAVYHGPARLRAIAERIHRHTSLLATAATEAGAQVVHTSYFDTLRLRVSNTEEVRLEAERRRVNLRYFDNGDIGISLDETSSTAEVAILLEVLSAAKGAAQAALDEEKATVSLGAELLRTDSVLSHPVFNSYHSETEMLRYLKSLENKDLSLAHSMIPLGSCTMKLNATTEMIPVTMPDFGALHPFVPRSQAAGYTEMFNQLENDLKVVTGFDAVSLQPNAGAQGEYAGLLVIKAYHEAQGNGHRNIALIPSSAHGTNPASAVMAGMHVVVVACDENGNIDVADLRAKAEKHSDNLSCLMVTYPSTHGVFESTISEVCSIIHQHGGRVYMDGANMNAQVGLTSPARIGADVCHLNLHKTFCIPHGGGGPGMGPICVVADLAPYLPGHPVVDMGSISSNGAVSAAPWGSASILLISWAYIRMMGGDGLTDATKYAILNANYIAKCLEGNFEILYRGENGRVAHELIVDMRMFKQTAKVEVEDVAKRLMDYGFHAPTVSFPVAGTIMIEPTESEGKEEMDRFCEALLSIREEIRAIENGSVDAADNVLKHAPHTVGVITADEWTRPYSRSQAAWPLPWLHSGHKFWPSVGRVNNAAGDRTLICTCTPIEAYMEQN